MSTEYRCKDCKHDKGKCVGSTRRGWHKNCFEPKVVTNADRIRVMSDSELANFMVERSVNESTLLLINENHGLTAIQIEALKQRIYCACMQWLKQPAEEA